MRVIVGILILGGLSPPPPPPIIAKCSSFLYNSVLNEKEYNGQPPPPNMNFVPTALHND